MIETRNSQTVLGGNTYDRPFREKSLADHADDDTIDGIKRSNQNTRIVQYITIGLTSLMFAMLIVVIGVCAATYKKVEDFTVQTVSVYDSLGLPGYAGYAWVCRICLGRCG